MGAAAHPQILADQLTLTQPGGADYAHQILLSPPDFQTFLRPWDTNTFLQSDELKPHLLTNMYKIEYRIFISLFFLFQG